MELGLTGKNVLMFGGNGAIGSATTLAFAKEGANIALASRDLEANERFAKLAREQGSGKAIAVRCDATQWGDVEAAVQTARDEFGSIDICYHGLAYDHMGSFFDLPVGEWDKIIDINLKSALIAFKQVLPIMREQKHGSYIMMSSVMGRQASPWEPVYGACKAALINLVHTLAYELGPDGVRINCVAPGPTPPTDITLLGSGSGFKRPRADKGDPRIANRREQWMSATPLRKFGNPNDAAAAVLFLASDLTGGHQTGQVIGVDGGWFRPH